MTSSSRRLRRPLPRGGRLALVVPTALLAITAMVSPSFADDVTPDDGGDPPAVTETETPPAEPEPAPEAEPKPEPKPEPKDDPKPEPKPEPKDDEATEEASEEATEEAEATPIEIPEDAVPAGKAADTGARLVAKVVALADINTKKVVICKYSATPEIGEKAQTIVIRDTPNDFPEPVSFPFFFNDAQIASIAIRHPLDGESSNDLDIDAECPPYVPPGLVVAPDLTVNDPCGPGNAAYNPVPAGNYSVTINPDGSILLTANEGYVFEGDLPTHSYPAPVDSNAPCPATAPAEPDVIDDCGPNNAYYTNVPESTEEYTVVAEPAEKPTTITITANDGFVFEPDAPVIYTVEDSNTPCPATAPDEPAVTDDCGPDNAYFTTVPESTEEYTVVAEPAEKPTTITITANPGFVFTPDEPVVYTAVDSDEPCIGAAPAEPDVIDDCGPNNAYYTNVPESTEEYTVVAEPAEKPTTITITANDGFVFEPDAPVIYTVEDSNTPCPATAPDEPAVTDDCGPDNAYFTTVPESTEEYTVVAEPAEKPTTITITANEGFVFTPDAPVVYTVEDSGDLCVVVAPEEPGVTDECGPDNAYYTTVPESTDEYTVVAEPEVNPTKITITATEGNAFDEQDTLVIVYEVTDSGEACPIYVACVYPTAQVDDVAPRVALSLIPKGVLAIVDQAEALLNGFLGTFPYTYAQGASEVTILQELPDGVDLSAFDAATLCGAVAGIVEEPPTVGGIVEELPDTGGPAGWLVPLGSGLVLAGAALVLARRRETV